MSVFCTALFDWIIYRCTDFGKKTAEVISFSVIVALLGIISAVINYLVGTFAIKLCGKYSFELLYTVTDNYLEGSYLVQKKLS